MRTMLLIPALFVLVATAATGATVRVPGDHPTIQAGIDAAVAGDTVLVACGTYYEHDINMKSSITLRSETGQADCVVIDAAQAGRVIACVNASIQTRLEGLTITGGLLADPGVGGGLYCSASSPTLTNVTFSYNQACDAGGMYAGGGSSPVLTDVVFSHNHAYSGGGLYCDGSSPALTNVVFSGNESWWGGGMYCMWGSPTLTRCSFLCNSVSSGVGGGGLWCRGATPILTYCTFAGNSAGQRGGGLVCEYYTDATLVSCTIAGNSAPDGGGMWLGPDRPFSYAHATLTNCIVAFSTDGQAISIVEGSGAALTCCDVYGNAGGDWVGYIAGQYGSNGDISQEPCFCLHANPEQPYALCINSPCAAENNPGCGQIGAWPAACDDYDPCPTEQVSWGSLKAMFR